MPIFVPMKTIESILKTKTPPETSVVVERESPLNKYSEPTKEQKFLIFSNAFTTSNP